MLNGYPKPMLDSMLNAITLKQYRSNNKYIAKSA